MTLTGCAYRYYLGMHGPSIKGYADIHTGISKDKECLECHAPQDNPQGPVTTHPQFIGCLRCHNDKLKEKKTSSLHE
jgi:predicted CXXCH cytochrome family protein